MKKLTSFKFVLHLLFFDALLNRLAALSCHLQGDSVDLLFALASIESLYAAMQRLLSDSSDSEKTTELSIFLDSIKASDGNGFVDEVSFKGVKLLGVLQTTLTAFQTSHQNYINALTHSLHGRFDDLQQQDVFKGVKLLDPRIWPTDQELLKSFGHRELSLVTLHFKLLLKDVNIDLLVCEWDTIKMFWLDNLREMSRQDVLSTLLSRLESKYPNLVHLIELLLVFPVSNAKVECGFSAMRRIKVTGVAGLVKRPWII